MVQIACDKKPQCRFSGHRGFLFHAGFTHVVAHCSVREAYRSVGAGPFFCRRAHIKRRAAMLGQRRQADDAGRRTDVRRLLHVARRSRLARTTTARRSFACGLFCRRGRFFRCGRRGCCFSRRRDLRNIVDASRLGFLCFFRSRLARCAFSFFTARGLFAARMRFVGFAVNAA